MTACEACWAEASRLALIKGGTAADYYRDVLASDFGKNHEDQEGPR